MDAVPAFGEPWHAQVLAMADLLVTSGRLSAWRWSEALGVEIETAKASGQPDETEAYFCAALSALAHLLAENGCVDRAELTRRQQQWERAYRRTPHGQPVDLRCGQSPE